ncbi:hypothetical protein ACQBAU_01900 [Propionibacteriaceae bacterium Y2011]
MSMSLNFLLFQLPFLVFPLALLVASILAVKGSGRWLLAGGFAVHLIAGTLTTFVPFLELAPPQIGLVYSGLAVFRAVGWALVVAGVIVAFRHGNRAEQSAAGSPAWQVPGVPPQGTPPPVPPRGQHPGPGGGGHHPGW